MMSHRRERGAFTLLEMILSLAIGLVILGAVYIVLSSQVRLTQKGRDVLEDGTIARAVLTRMTADIQGTLGPVDLRVVPDYATGGTEPETTEMTEETTGGTTTGGTATTTKSSSMSSSSMKTESSSSTGNTLYYNVGVDGAEDRLILTIGKATRPLTDDPAEIAGLRRILYWMTPAGLARKEILNVTGPEMDLTPDTVPEPELAVIAPEVVAVKFEYSGGAGFTTSWRGMDPAGDLSQPIGPPIAIRITLTLRKRGGVILETGEPETVQFEHVIAIPAGNNFPTEAP